MNVIFVAYRKWAHQILETLLKQQNATWKISATISIPSSEAEFNKLPIPNYEILPQNLSKEESYKEIIEKHNPTIFLVYGWSWMVPQYIYKSYPALILHTSPLPKYRGGSPLQHQILAGEKISAITIFQADEGIDTGPIYSQSVFSLKGHMDEIFKRIVEAGTKDTIRVLDGIANKTLEPVPQDESKATYFKRRTPKQSEITPEDIRTKTANELYNFIRALEDPYPNAFIICKDDKKLYIKKAERSE